MGSTEVVIIVVNCTWCRSCSSSTTASTCQLQVKRTDWLRYVIAASAHRLYALCTVLSINVNRLGLGGSRSPNVFGAFLNSHIFWLVLAIILKNRMKKLQKTNTKNLRRCEMSTTKDHKCVYLQPFFDGVTVILAVIAISIYYQFDWIIMTFWLTFNRISG